MPIQKTEGILIRRQDLRETSLILTFYTKDFGKIKGIARGVRGSRAQTLGGGGAFEILSLDEIVFYERKSGDIFTISQCDLVEFFVNVRGSLERLSYATYIAELLDSVTSLGDANDEAFSLLLNSLNLLSGAVSPKRVTRIFEIKLLNLLGLMPALDNCVHCGQYASSAIRFSLRHGGILCRKCADSDKQALSIMPGTVKFIEHIRVLPFEKVERIKVAHEVGAELEITLRKYLDYHIERNMKTLKFIKETGN